MSRNRSRRTTVRASELGIVGVGDETAAFQNALDRLGRSGPAVLVLEKSRCYTVRELRGRNGVTLKGDNSTIQSVGDSKAAEGYLFTIGRGADFALEGISLKAACLFRCQGDGILRLKRVRLQPAKGGPFESAFLVTQRSRLIARDCIADHISGNETPATVQDHASLEWRGGEVIVGTLCIFDSANARIDLPASSDGSSCWRRGDLLIGRFAGKCTTHTSGGSLWDALTGTPEAFKQVLDNPKYGKAFSAWERHNRTQNGKVTLHIAGKAPPSNTAAPNVRIYGSYTVQARDSLLGVAVPLDQARFTMRGGELRRNEAYGLSRTHFKDVNLVMHGSDDPWHPKTTYLQGNHNMEFSHQWNDLMPTVIFEGGRIEFAGDDCLNGLPEPRAMQLMEIVHDHTSLFPCYAALQAFEPETLTPGTRVGEIKGHVGATHNEDTEPIVPFDFRESGFTWQGEYSGSEPNRVGDVRAFQGPLYVCNRDNTGIAPNAVFNAWQLFHVGFRNEKGYIEVARRMRKGDGWIWQRMQALGKWAGFTMRERGNPVITYHVRLILKNTSIIRRANTWSFCISPAVPVGNSGYNYLLSCYTSNVHYNHNCNVIECRNVRVRNVGVDALPPIRGLSLGPNPYIATRHSFRNVQISGESIGAPVVFRVWNRPLIPGNQVVLQDVTARYNRDMDTEFDCGAWKYMRKPGGAETMPSDARVLRPVVPGHPTNPPGAE